MDESETSSVIGGQTGSGSFHPTDLCRIMDLNSKTGFIKKESLVRLLNNVSRVLYHSGSAPACEGQRSSVSAVRVGAKMSFTNKLQ